MLRLILGRGKSGKTTRLLEMLRDCPAAGMAQRILIVPEQLSHQTERALAELCGDGISYVSEVLSFTRLSSRVKSIYGGGARTSLDQGGRILTAQIALRGIRTRLKIFASAAAKADFLNNVVNMIDEFKTYKIGPAQLLEASAQTEGQLAQKLQELSEMLGAYDAAIAQGNCDPRDNLTMLCEQLQATDYAERRHFFVDGFTDFSRQERDVLEMLLSRGESLTVTLPLDPQRPDDPLFAPGRETAARLLSMADRLGQKTEIVKTEFRRILPPALAYLEKNLFFYEAPPLSDSCDAIEIVSASDRLEECRHCAAELRRQAMAGVRWREMAVASGDIEAYCGLLVAVCQDYGVPLYTGAKTPLTEHPVTAFLLCALEAAVEGMETETVVSYLHTGYSGISPDGCDALENYAFVWGVRGRKWEKTWTEHPEGYGGIFTDETQQELQKLNQLREQAIKPLSHLAQGLKSGNTRGQMEAVYRFLEETALFSQVSDRVQNLTEKEQLQEAQEMAQIWNMLMTCLQQAFSALENTSQNRNDLYELLKLAFSQYELGTIPAALDEVSFGSMDAVRGKEPKLLYVLGANEGLLPAAPARGSLLSERERGILLEQLQMELAPNEEGAMERQLLQIYSAMTAPTEKLILSYAEASVGQQLSPSYLIGRITNLLPGAVLRSIRKESADAMTPESMAQFYLTAEETDDLVLAESIRQAAQECPELEQILVTAKAASLPREMKITKKMSEKLFGAPVTLTASRLDQLGSCPLSFFLNYGMHAAPRKEAEFDAMEFGTFLHYILEKTLGDIQQNQNEFPLSSAESAELVKKNMEPYLQSRLQETENLSSREQYLYRRNSSEAQLLLLELSQELSVSSFRPCAFELRFGRGTDLGTLPVQGSLGSGRLSGVVDRADIWRSPQGDFVRIIDYKSGTKSFDYTELFGGVGMQLFLYLFTLNESGISDISANPLPAGALYFPAKRGILNVDNPMDAEETEKLRRKKGAKSTGLVLADDQVLEAMEHGGEEYLPIKRSKNGLGDYAVTQQQMLLLKDFIKEKMSQAVDQIYSGNFEPSPFYRGASHDPCQWCDYLDVCQKDPDFRRKHYHSIVKAGDFWDMIGGEPHG